MNVSVVRHFQGWEEKKASVLPCHDDIRAIIRHFLPLTIPVGVRHDSPSQTDQQYDAY